MNFILVGSLVRGRYFEG